MLRGGQQRNFTKLQNSLEQDEKNGYPAEIKTGVPVQECQLRRKQQAGGQHLPFIALRWHRPNSQEHRSSPSHLGDDKQSLHKPRRFNRHTK